ncbi:MAG: hypothetical protein DDT19_00029 [Syntrophomonadaceae bacterium]|nr:hypothetical protein [Bacillota bacterium]
MRLNVGKKSIIITVAIVGGMFAVAIGVTYLLFSASSIKEKEKQTVIAPATPEQTDMTQVAPITDAEKKQIEPLLEEKDRREVELLKEEGRFVTGVGDTKPVAPKESASAQLERDLFGDEPKKGGSSESQQLVEQLLQQQQPSPAVNDPKEQLWSYMYVQANRRVSGGGFVAQPNPKIEPEDDKKASDTVKSALPGFVRYFKPYNAVVNKGFNSLSTKPIFQATITQPGPLLGWRVIGTATPNYNTERFEIVITSLMSADDTSYPVSGYAASIDETDGIITLVRHDEIKGIMTSGMLSAADTFMDVLRRDEKTIIIQAGQPVIGEVKDPDRVREAGKAAASSVARDVKARIEPTIKKVPTLIVEKNTPIIVYFIKSSDAK